MDASGAGLVVAHQRRTGPFFAWRPPAPGESSNFEVLVGRRWQVATGAGCISASAALLVLPRRQVEMLRTFAVTTALAGILGLVDNIRNTAFPVLRYVDLPLRDLPEALDGLRIAQLSDFHLGMPLSVRAVRRAVAAVETARPDLIVLTGDFVSYRRHLPLLRHMLRPLQAPHGVYAILGNHDHLAAPAAVARLLGERGVTVLVNEHRAVAIGDATLVIAGVDDMWRGQPDLEAALAGVPAGAPIILLAHAPDYADIAAQAPVAVQLAGHTHGGHIRLPGLGPLVLPRHGICYDQGLWRVGCMWLYVSQGLGGLPLRLGCRTEATLLTLRRTA